MPTRGQAMIHRERADAVERVVNIVADFYRIPAEDILGEARAVEVVEARQVAIWICRAAYLWDYASIGRLFQRDHTTVINGIRHLTQRAHGNPYLHRRMVHLAQLAARQEVEA